MLDLEISHYTTSAVKASRVRKYRDCDDEMKFFNLLLSIYVEYIPIRVQMKFSA